jgi:hypothetical protein
MKPPKFSQPLPMLLLALLALLTACVPRLRESETASPPGEVQQRSPLPTIADTPTLHPVEATLTFEATCFPATPGPEISTKEASAPSGEGAPLTTLLPTPTMSRIIDLAEGLPDSKIFIAIVRRADGAYEADRLPRDTLATANNFMQKVTIQPSANLTGTFRGAVYL